MRSLFLGSGYIWATDRFGLGAIAFWVADIFGQRIGLGWGRSLESIYIVGWAKLHTYGRFIGERKEERGEP